MKSGKFIWGLVFLCIGTILIGLNMGWWDQSIWNYVYSFWPIFLILLGLAMITDNGYVFLAIIIVVSLAAIWMYRIDFQNFRESANKLFPVTTINLNDLINKN